MKMEHAIARWVEGCNPANVRVRVSDGLVVATCRTLLEADRLCRYLARLDSAPVERVEIWAWVEDYPGHLLHYCTKKIEPNRYPSR